MSAAAILKLKQVNVRDMLDLRVVYLTSNAMPSETPTGS